MKINFIRHISDDILKENQELKNTIISTKMALKSNSCLIQNIRMTYSLLSSKVSPISPS